MPISEIFQLFRKLLQELVDFDKITLLHGLCVCASISLLSESQILYSCAIDKGIPIDFELSNVLMSMYTNTGNVEDARNVFNHSMPNHDVISWTTMIVAYAQHTHAREAVELFQLMYQKQGIKPTQISFVDILSACSHSGLVDEGCEFFSSMMNEFSIIPTATHYSCLLDLLGRSGQLNKAESILATIPIQPERVLWITMFSACKIHEDFKRGDWIANHIMFQLVDHQDSDMTKCGEICCCIDADSSLQDEVVDDGKRKMGMSIEARLIMAPTLKDVEMDEVYVELKTLSTSSTNDADDSKDVSQISGECNYWFENNYHGDEIQQLVSMLR
jgi:pentatricopeptide repeat protein